MTVRLLENLIMFVAENPQRRAKQAVAVLFDCAASAGALWLAQVAVHGFLYPIETGRLIAMLAAPLIFIPIFLRLGLYRAVFRYSGAATIRIMIAALAVHLVLFVLLFWLILDQGLAGADAAIYGVLFPVLVVMSRFTVRFALTSSMNRAPVRLLIYGAGHAGMQAADALEKSLVYRVVGFVDDDPSRLGQMINNRRVWGTKDIPTLVSARRVDEIVIAMPSVSRRRQLALLSDMKEFGIQARILPAIDDLTAGRVAVLPNRIVRTEDILLRPVIEPEADLMDAAVGGKTVLVTGAAGSIGSEICRQALLHGAARLILVDHSEYGLYAVQRELETTARRKDLSVSIVPMLGSVRHYPRLRAIFGQTRPDVVFHAAAYKHVPLVELHPAEGVDTNVFGTLNAVRAAIELQVPSFTLVSTDKAVNPSSVMGASKRLAEMTVQSLAGEPSPDFGGNLAAIRKTTRMSVVRFGNVLDSSGSVIPLFRRQIAEGGPVTLTHTEVTRYFMTIAEASQLVIQASAMEDEDGIFVLDMGEPVRIADVAKRMIELSGFTVKSAANPAGDIAIDVIGLRRGEKLHEELFLQEDVHGTIHPRILASTEDFPAWSDLSAQLAKLRMFIERDDAEGIASSLSAIAGYRRDGEAPSAAVLGA